MSKNEKKAPPTNESSQESPAVAVSSKSESNSHLAEYEWRPGKSGNPAGRPKTSDLKAEVREFADELDPKLRKSRLRQWLEMADRRARQGSPKHLEMLLAYGWGRPSQAIELEARFSLAEVIDRARKRAEEEQKPALPATNSAHTAPAAAQTPEQDLSTAREDDAGREAVPVVQRGPFRRVVM